MNERNLKITFHLDGTGVYYDPAEPPMLDAILAAARARFHVHGEPPSRDERPDDIPLPLKQWHLGGTWGWHASALFPTVVSDEQIVYWRKRYRQKQAQLAEGSPNVTNGTYRDWNTPLPLLMTPALYGYCCYIGDPPVSRFKRDCKRDIRWIGKKRAHGRGCVVDITIAQVDEDYSLTKHGVSMRYLPDPDGFRTVRTRPPYWNIHDAVPCGEIGKEASHE